jgi:uncharacterized MnhB-related membrane protein
MTAFTILSTLFTIGLIASAVLVVMARSMVSAIVASAATGTFLTLLFLLMEAPDVALSEAAVGAVAVPAVMLISLAKIRALLDDPDEVE